MSLKLGNTAVNKLYLGATQINKSYLGATLVLNTGTPVVRINPGAGIRVSNDAYIDWEANDAVDPGSGGQQSDSGALWTMSLGNKFPSNVTWDVSLVTTLGYNESDILSLFDGEIFGDGLQYTFTLDDGDYDVILMFGEVFHINSGTRIFDILVNGVIIEDDLDMFIYTGGKFIAKPYIFSHTVTGSTPLVVRFNASVDNASVSGIEIRQK